MKKLIYTAFSACLILAYSCQNSDWKKAEDANFYYQIAPASNSSPKLDFGDLVRYRFSLYKDGKLLQNNHPNLDSLVIPPRDYRNIIEKALVLCKEGDSLALKFAYKELQSYLPQYQDKLKPNDELIFGIKIHSFVPKSTLEASQNNQFAQEKGFETLEKMEQERKFILDNATSYSRQLEVYTQNGLSAQNLRINEGLANNAPEQQYTAQTGDTVAVYYALATQPEGTIFDQNLQTADRFLFVINQDMGLLAGFHQAAQQLKLGEAAYFYIDSRLAYGAEGSLPVVKPNQNLGLFMKMAAIWKLQK